MKKIPKKYWIRWFIFSLFVSFILSVIFNIALLLSPNFYAYHAEENIVYDRNNQFAFSIHFNEYGSYVSLEKTSRYVKDALVASEDKRFYKHHGLDYLRIIKSAFNNLKKGEIKEGGSTITQQYARTLFLSNEKTLTRKIKEAWISKKLEQTLSKDEILEGYLNAAYFGHNIYGIVGASDYYYHKLPSELTLAESAMLIGILSAPTYYSPKTNLLLAKQKQRNVLNAMKKEKMITEREYFDALDENIQYAFSFQNEPSVQTRFYYDALKKQLEQDQITTSNYYKIGQEIYSCIDMEVQNKIETIVKSHPLNSEISVVVMKPFSGDVLALIGGKNYEESAYNRAIYAARQTGSTIKPLLYYLGLEYGMTPLTKMKSEPTTFYINGIGEYAPKNANEKYANRDISMVEAIALSDNVYATKTILLLGSKPFAHLLQRFTSQNVESNPTIGLGTNSMTPLELASLFNTFASEGAYYRPRFYQSVESSFHEKISSRKSTPSFYLNKESVIELNYMLRSPFDSAFKSYANPSLLEYAPEKRFSAKTGTTDADRWVVGYNPNYTICVWLGNDDNSPIQDGALAKIIFKEIANALMEKQKDTFYSATGLLPFYYQGKNGKTSYTYYEKK